MPINLTNHKIRILAQLAALLVLASVAVVFSLIQQQQQERNAALSRLAAELPNSARLMAELANADGQSHDGEDFYQALMDYVSDYDRIAGAFIRLSFPAELTGLDVSFVPELPPEALAAIDKLEWTWLDLRQGLFDALGPDFNAPRLRQAAEYVRANQSALEEASRDFSHTMQAQMDQENDRIRHRSDLALLIALALGGIIVVWLLLSRHHKKTAPSRG